jgi:hypothetical protein
MDAANNEFTSAAFNIADDEKVAGRGHDAHRRHDADAHFVHQLYIYIRRGPHAPIIAS